jgi:hypothetical protein
VACNSIVSESGNGTLLLEDINEISIPWDLNFDASNLSYNGRTIATVDDATFCQDITYKELKALRDEGKLKPGRQYKIIDYDTLYSFCRSFKEIKRYPKKHLFNLDEAREIFTFVAEEDYELFRMFYECSNVRLENGRLIPE